MLNLFTAIGEALKLIRVSTDPTKRREAYDLSLDKQSKKALEYAEESFFLMDSYILQGISEYKFKLRYRYLRKKFFENN